MKVVAILRYTFLETSNISKVMFSQIRPQTFLLLLHGIYVEELLLEFD